MRYRQLAVALTLNLDRLQTSILFNSPPKESRRFAKSRSQKFLGHKLPYFFWNKIYILSNFKFIQTRALTNLPQIIQCRQLCFIWQCFKIFFLTVIYNGKEYNFVCGAYRLLFQISLLTFCMCTLIYSNQGNLAQSFILRFFLNLKMWTYWLSVSVEIFHIVHPYSYVILCILLKM